MMTDEDDDHDDTGEDDEDDMRAKASTKVKESSPKLSLTSSI